MSDAQYLLAELHAAERKIVACEDHMAKAVLSSEAEISTEQFQLAARRVSEIASRCVGVIERCKATAEGFRAGRVRRKEEAGAG